MYGNFIGIYKDSGATWQLVQWALTPLIEPYGLQAVPITRADVMDHQALHPKRTRLAAVVLPGSDHGSQIYRDHFGETGFQHFRDFCAHGGMAMGICAGVGPLVTAVNWHSPKLTRYTTENANMVRGTLHGPMPQLLHPDADRLGGWFKANTTHICIPGEDIDPELMYWGGGYFVADEEVNVLARFRNVLGPDGKQAIAVAHKSYGLGDVVLSNIHPEATGPLLAKNVGEAEADTDVDARKGTYRGELIERLNRSEGARNRLLFTMLQPMLERRAYAAYRTSFG